MFIIDSHGRKGYIHFSYAINIVFFSGTNFNKKCDEVQQKFLEHLALEVNYLLMILCSISFHSYLVEVEVNPTIVKKDNGYAYLTFHDYITLVFIGIFLFIISCDCIYKRRG